MKVAFVLIIIIIFFYLVTKRLKIVGASALKTKSYNGNTLFYFFTMVLLVLVSGLRGDFFPDYRGFYYTYYVNNAYYGMSNIFNSRAISFTLICYIARQIFHSYQAAIFFVGAITVLLYGAVIKKYSVNYFLSFILLVGVDNYVVSFNIIRNIFSVALCLWAMKNIYENKIWNYIFVVLLAATMHSSAMLMLPMYWILRIDFSKKKNFYILLGALILAFLVFFNINYVAHIALNIFLLKGYGEDLSAINHYTGLYTSVLKSAGLFLFIVFFHKLINFDNLIERVWFNACMIAFVFQILAIRINLVQRMSYYFSACFILLIPLIVSRMKNKNVISALIIVLLLIYCGIIQNGITEYWFFWNNQIIPV